MRTPFSLVATAILSVGFTGCEAPRTNVPDASTMAPPRNQTIELPRVAGDDVGKEVSVLIDEPHLKLATIALRNGTPLPPHSAPVPITIQVLEGEGVIHVGGEPVSLARGSIVSLVPGELHDVVTREGSDMLLLVHYLRGAK